MDTIKEEHELTDEELEQYGLVKNNSGNYVDKEEFYIHIRDYGRERDRCAKEGLPKPQIDNFIADAIMQIANRLSFKPIFSGYTFREDMVCDAIENCITYIDNFDAEQYKNPFAYFTQVCYYAFIRRIKTENKQSKIKGKLIMSRSYDDNLIIDADTDKAVIEDTLRNTHKFVELASEEDEKQRLKAEERKRLREEKKREEHIPTPLEELFV